MRNVDLLKVLPGDLSSRRSQNSHFSQAESRQTYIKTLYHNPPAFAEVTIRHGDDIPSVAAPTQPSNQSSQRPPPQIDHARLPPPLSRKPAGLGGSCLPSLECRRPLAPAVPPLPQTDHPRGLSGSGVPPRANLQPGSGTGLFPAATVCPAQGRGSFVGWMLSGVSRLQRNGQSDGAANPPPGSLASAPKAALHAVQQASRQQLTQKEPRQLQPLTPDKDDASLQRLREIACSNTAEAGVCSSRRTRSGPRLVRGRRQPLRMIEYMTCATGPTLWDVGSGKCVLAVLAHCQVKLGAGDRVWCDCDCPKKDRQRLCLRNDYTTTGHLRSHQAHTGHTRSIRGRSCSRFGGGTARAHSDCRPR
ncbi:hypothetical protein WJX75_008034 [Coccomyxa subellipsoidea]|uniref:Uncharacterized protein n=1 Tax=Coccomyxa subellipsoidea TaxID=248742 RepID=A0ABR2YIE5_9CHLO